MDLASQSTPAKANRKSHKIIVTESFTVWTGIDYGAGRTEIYPKTKGLGITLPLR